MQVLASNDSYRQIGDTLFAERSDPVWKYALRLPLAHLGCTGDALWRFLSAHPDWLHYRDGSYGARPTPGCPISICGGAR